MPLCLPPQTGSIEHPDKGNTITVPLCCCLVIFHTLQVVRDPEWEGVVDGEVCVLGPLADIIKTFLHWVPIKLDAREALRLCASCGEALAREVSIACLCFEQSSPNRMTTPTYLLASSQILTQYVTETCLTRLFVVVIFPFVISPQSTDPFVHKWRKRLGKASVLLKEG